MAKPNLDRVLQADVESVRSGVARHMYDKCVQNAIWVKYENNPDITDVFLRKIAKRYSFVTKSYVYALNPTLKGNFYRDENELVKAFFWKNGALLILDEGYELYIHMQEVERWNLNG